MNSRFIQNKDINDMFQYCKKNLSNYRLVYNRTKVLYFLICCLSILAFLIMLFSLILNFFFDANINYEGNAICTLILSAITLILWRYMDIKVADLRNNIQSLRITELKKYLYQQGFTGPHIVILRNRFNEEYTKRKKDNLKILAVLAVLLLPFWDKFVDYLFIKSSTNIVNITLHKFELLAIIILFLLAGVALFLITEKYILFLVNKDSRICLSISNLLEHIIEFEDINNSNDAKSKKEGGSRNHANIKK